MDAAGTGGSRFHTAVHNMYPDFLECNKKFSNSLIYR